MKTVVLVICRMAVVGKHGNCCCHANNVKSDAGWLLLRNIVTVVVTETMLTVTQDGSCLYYIIVGLPCTYCLIVDASVLLRCVFFISFVFYSISECYYCTNRVFV